MWSSVNLYVLVVLTRTQLGSMGTTDRPKPHERITPHLDQTLDERHPRILDLFVDSAGLTASSPLFYI